MSEALRQSEVGGAEKFGVSFGKLKTRHLRRKALVYVRQSTLHQLRHNVESARLQRALVHQAQLLGFAPTQIELLDEDQGKSGTSAEGREGFARLLELVQASQVGLVMSSEVSRLCRSSLDWQYLLRHCELSDTLLGDQEGLYDMSDSNDRMLLGLKGTLSEFELAMIRRRMEQGKWNKARRGELRLAAPMGYVNAADGKLIKDPNDRVCQCVELLFEMFEKKGSVHALLRFFQQNNFKLPRRQRGGPNSGELVWEEANQSRVVRALKNPLYSGRYVYGRNRVDPSKKKPGKPWSGLVALPPEQWRVNIEGKHDAYISVEQFERNLERLAQNRPQGLGASREGPSLLAGLLFCERCHTRLQVSYKNNGGGLRYHCLKERNTHGGERCLSLCGEALERCVEQLVLEALEPAAVSLHLRVLEDLKHENKLLLRAKEQALEEARYQSQIAQRRYEAHDPQHRLVSRSLEEKWEEALSEEQHLEQELARFRRQSAEKLSEEQKQHLQQLCSQVPNLFHASTTTPKQRQQLVRLLVEKAEVSASGRSEKLTLTLRWKGGEQTQHSLRRNVARYEQLSFYNEMIEKLEELAKDGQSDEQIAQSFEVAGFHNPYGEGIGEEQVARLRRRKGLYRGRRRC